VALASFVLIPHNLLLLDEPSNHLDLTTLKVKDRTERSLNDVILEREKSSCHRLTAALRKFEGSVVVISHDRRFLEELEPTHVVTVRGGKVRARAEYCCCVMCYLYDMLHAL
jgi:ATP-binding cassette, subfamily F, member 3